MSEVLLNFDLAPDLFLDLIGDNFGFVEGLEGENILWFCLCANHVYSTEFAFAQRSTDVKGV